MNKLKMRFGFSHVLAVSSMGQSGGLALLWNIDIELFIKSFSDHFIDAEVGSIGVAGRWRLTGFYSFPATTDRDKSWVLLSQLGLHNHLPWLCVGDFNELLFAHEKEGGLPRSDRQMEGFREVVYFCAFQDLGFSGYKFTWKRNYAGEVIRERLDRALADWQDHFPLSYVLHLDPCTSDHLPILVVIQSQQRRRRPSRKRFCFEEMWSAHADYERVVQQGWSAGSWLNPTTRFEKRQSSTSLKLRTWSLAEFGNTARRLSDLQAKLAVLFRAPYSSSLEDEKRVVQGDLNALLQMDEIYWRQRSRAIWLKAGDKNSKFFHQHANHRRKRNLLRGILDEEGRWHSNDAGIEKTVLDYFTQLFSSAQGEGMGEILDGLECRVSPEMNHSLMQPFCSDEIKHALFQMHPSKAPGPDGMSPFFYQKYWAIFGDDVVRAVTEYFRCPGAVSKNNSTFVALIPKVREVRNMSHIRPISLCNVIYRIGAKVLANRLKDLLHHIISPNQSAFVPGRLISDNSIVAFEMAHHLRKRRHGKKACMVIKLDMSKAYDRVEWNFLEEIMLKLGFHAQWVEMLMACVRTVTYSFLINGEPRGNLHPSRGLRQGDPISPYLFLFCTEGLTTLLNTAECRRELQGITICRGAPSVSHLFFADDSFIFARANSANCYHLRHILELYERASGQKINCGKSTVAFSSNIPIDVQGTLAHQLGVNKVSHHDIYLGLPMVVGC
ncbi:hypothetical protein CerSpe_241100 [Prunus speciosa]